jgi:hypothetical protein
VSGAHVFVDGVEAGVTGDTPVRIPLITGSYEVRLEKPRYTPAAGHVPVAPGQTTVVGTITPVLNIPPIALLSDRDGVDVMAGGVSLGRMVTLSTLRAQVSPDESRALDRFVASAKLDPHTAAGIIIRQPPLDRAVTMSFHRDCFVDDTRSIALTSDLLGTLDPAEPIAWLGDAAVLRLQADVGTVRIASIPSDADVFLDGQLAGRTPFDREVCAGAHRIRIKHRIGSYNIATTVTRGRTEAVDVTLKPDLAFLGAVDSAGAAAPDLAALVDRALAVGVTSYHLASRQELPPETKPWADGLTAELVAAVDKGDRDAIARLQTQAGANYDAALLLCAVRRPGAAQIDLLLFWTDHASVDRIAIAGGTSLAGAIAQINAPVDVGNLTYQSDIGVRVAETDLTAARLLIVAVRPGSTADAAGVKPGETIDAVDRAPSTAVHLADTIASRKPGDLIVLRVVNANGNARDVSIAVRRVAARVPAFDTTRPGNTLIARLTAQAILTSASGDRDLIAFNLAVTYMRYGDWRRALGLLTALTNVPRGEGIGPGMAKYLAARCHEELGERDQALALYKDAAAIDGEVASDDGATVGALSRYRLAWLAGRGGH